MSLLRKTEHRVRNFAFETHCCHQQVHQQCWEICENYLWKCPICRDNLSQIKIFFEYLPSQFGGIIGGYAYFNNRLCCLEAIRDRHYPILNRVEFGRTVHFYLPRDGNFASCARVDRLRFLDLVDQINQVKPEDEHPQIIEENPHPQTLSEVLGIPCSQKHTESYHLHQSKPPKHVGSRQKKKY